MTNMHSFQHEQTTENQSKTEGKGRRKLSIDLMKEMAKERDGRCLSRNYVNSLTKLSWRCKEGHTWKASANSIRNGSWCPKCCKRGGRRPTLTIEQMKTLASQRGGVCLSSEYKASHLKLEWQCSQGHEWKATPASIKGGSWCPTCYHDTRRVLKYTIEDMKELAAEKEGTCLSPAYLGVAEHLQWQCKEGHIWRASPNSIRSGSWCPTCERASREERFWKAYREMKDSTT